MLISTLLNISLTDLWGNWAAQEISNGILSTVRCSFKSTSGQERSKWNGRASLVRRAAFFSACSTKARIEGDQRTNYTTGHRALCQAGYILAKETSETLAPHCLHCLVFVLQRKHFTSVNSPICSWAIYSFSLPGINPEPLIYCVSESWRRSSWRVSKLPWQSQPQGAQTPTGSMALGPLCSPNRPPSPWPTRTPMPSAWWHAMVRTWFSTEDTLHQAGLNCSHPVVTDNKV